MACGQGAHVQRCCRARYGNTCNRAQTCSAHLSLRGVGIIQMMGAERGEELLPLDPETPSVIYDLWELGHDPLFHERACDLAVTPMKDHA